MNMPISDRIYDLIDQARISSALSGNTPTDVLHQMLEDLGALARDIEDCIPPTRGVSVTQTMDVVEPGSIVIGYQA